MRRVIFACFGPGGPELSQAEASKRANEVWTVNDWYQKMPRLPCPDRVFNIHSDITAHADDPTRFAGDTIKKYNESGAEIVTSRYYPELYNCKPFALHKLLDIRKDPFFSSSLAAMFVMAWLECWDEIELVGVQLGLGAEHEGQLPAVAGAISESERRGIRVINPFAEEWARRGGYQEVPWHNAGGLNVTYWALQHPGIDAPGMVKKSAERQLPYQTFDKVNL